MHVDGVMLRLCVIVSRVGRELWALAYGECVSEEMCFLFLQKNISLPDGPDLSIELFQ
jgi:hypothetical protein